MKLKQASRLKVHCSRSSGTLPGVLGAQIPTASGVNHNFPVVLPIAFGKRVSPAVRFVVEGLSQMNSWFQFLFRPAQGPASVLLIRLAVGLIFLTQGILKYIDPNMGVVRPRILTLRTPSTWATRPAAARWPAI